MAQLSPEALEVRREFRRQYEREYRQNGDRSRTLLDSTPIQNVQPRTFYRSRHKTTRAPNTKVTGGNSTMMKHEEFLCELLIHEIETKAELTRMYFDCFLFI